MPIDPVESEAVRQALVDEAVDQQLRRGGTVLLAIEGVSMLPTLTAGQKVRVDSIAGPMRGGDLLVYRQDEYLVVHRLLGAARRSDGRRSLRTRGDGRNEFDPHLDPQNVIGRVVALQDGEVWRGTRSLPARLYGKALGWHDFAWASAGSLARAIDSTLGWSGGLAACVAFGDRLSLRLVHRILFRLLHRPIQSAASGTASPTGEEQRL